jgi:hemolysin D
MKHRFEALRELIERYRRTFKYFWGIRDRGQQLKFNASEAEFLPAALAIQEKPVSKTARVTALLLVSLLLLALVWSVLGKLEITVNGTGKIVSASRTKVVSSAQNAIVKAIHVEEGTHVNKDDLIIELVSAEADSEYQKALHSLLNLLVDVERHRAFLSANDQLQTHNAPPLAFDEIFVSSLSQYTDQVLNTCFSIPESRRNIAQSKEPFFPALKSLQFTSRDSSAGRVCVAPPQEVFVKNIIERANQELRLHHSMFRQRVNQYDAEIKRDRMTLPLARKVAADYKELNRFGDASTHAYFEKETLHRNIEGQLASNIAQRESYITQTKRDAWDAIIEKEKNISSVQKDLMRYREIALTHRLVAPISGIVQQLSLYTVGGVTAATQPIMNIVPDSNEFEIEAFIANKDIGFVEKGQTAQVKVEAFDYTKYGTVPGKVAHISPDSLLDEKKNTVYAIKVLLDRTALEAEGVRKKLAAGMAVTVEIKTGERRIIEYLLSPIAKTIREATNER